MSKKLNILTFLMILFIVNKIQPQIKQAVMATKEPRQYEKTEWNITLQAEWTNPYHTADVALDMEITSPTGKKMILPCFYVSGESNQESHWQARFTPREAGAFQYKFRLMDNGKIISTTPLSEFSTSTSNKKGFLQPYNNWSFQFDNGELFRGIGENIGWEARMNDDSRYFKVLHENPRFNYRYMLSKLAANGGNFFRTWMIFWNLPVDWKIAQNSHRYQNSTSQFNESGIKRMDELIHLCDSLGVYMMLVLDSHAGFVGSGWEMNNYNIKNGGFAATPLEFFTLEKAHEQYKDKLRFMIARWGYSPAIAAWEFFNEIDNVMYAGPTANRIPDSIITEWHREMSEYLEQHDLYQHLVTTSISHRDVKGLNDLPYIDFNQRHIYKNTVRIPEAINNYSLKHRKPYIIGEFSYEWDWQKNFNDFGDEMDSDFKRGLWYGLFSPTPVLPMTWWWEFFESREMMPYFNRVREIHNNMLNAGKGDYVPVPVTVSAKDIVAFGVQCGAKYYVYLYNPAKNEIHTNISFKIKAEHLYVIDSYNCETGIYRKLQEISPESSNLDLKEFELTGKMDVVLVFNKLIN